MINKLPNKPRRLRAHLEQHLHILDTLPFAILQISKKYKVVWANLAANELLQMDPVSQSGRQALGRVRLDRRARRPDGRAKA